MSESLVTVLMPSPVVQMVDAWLDESAHHRRRIPWRLPVAQMAETWLRASATK